MEGTEVGFIFLIVGILVALIAAVIIIALVINDMYPFERMNKSEEDKYYDINALIQRSQTNSNSRKKK